MRQCAYEYAKDYNEGMSFSSIAEKHGVTEACVRSSGMMFIVFPKCQNSALTDEMFQRADDEARRLGQIDKEVEERYRRLIAHRAKECVKDGRHSDSIIRWAKLAE